LDKRVRRAEPSAAIREDHHCEERSRIAAALLAGFVLTVAVLVVAQPAQASNVCPMRNGGSGLFVSALGTYNGAPVVQCVCNGSVAPRWARVDLGNGYHLYQGVASTATHPDVPGCAWRWGLRRYGHRCAGQDVEQSGTGQPAAGDGAVRVRHAGM
jgi:hypothetical protein